VKKKPSRTEKNQIKPRDHLYIAVVVNQCLIVYMCNPDSVGSTCKSCHLFITALHIKPLNILACAWMPRGYKKNTFATWC